MAWLNSSPKTLNKEKKKRRFETLPDGHHAKQLPIANQYLTECFNLSGRFSLNGTGMSPLSWLEIDAFSNRSSCYIDDWEAEIIYSMSCDYCNMHSKADGENIPAPYSTNIKGRAKEMQEMRDRIDAQLEKLFK